MKIKFFTTGGTIDKVYFDQKSAFKVGAPQITELLELANVVFDYEIETILQKDSLDMKKKDRRLIYEKVRSDESQYIIITHGTDTMIETAIALQDIQGKTIVLTGAMQPARFRESDAIFNIGCAVTAVQSLPYGVYVVMNGRIFDPTRLKKNIELNRFEDSQEE